MSKLTKRIDVVLGPLMGAEENIYAKLDAEPISPTMIDILGFTTVAAKSQLLGFEDDARDQDDAEAKLKLRQLRAIVKRLTARFKSLQAELSKG